MISGAVNETLYDYRLFVWQQYGLVAILKMVEKYPYASINWQYHLLKIRPVHTVKIRY